MKEEFTDLEHPPDSGTLDDNTAIHELLKALACVVVDDLIEKNNSGLSPEEVETIYSKPESD